MYMRRHAAALATICACAFAAPALAQPSRTYGPVEPARTAPPAPAAQRISNITEAPSAAPALRDGMLSRMELGGGAELGLGRFRVGDIPSRRSNMEMERNPAALERPSRAIAGAGLRIRFD
jgi:hypothetical protein